MCDIKKNSLGFRLWEPFIGIMELNHILVDTKPMLQSYK
jgi:hypothetical protein